jgi:NAD(P)-dependent dehydrogenase (short-subunit alcohol dehydrogenase family)
MQKQLIGLERAGLPTEIGRVAGFLASGFSSYITGANIGQCSVFDLLSHLLDMLCFGLKY